MNSFRHASVYILTIILLIAGILVFAFKGKLLAYMSSQVFGDGTNLQEKTLQASVNGLIDTEIFKDSAFKGLEDKVQYFDFNYVGKPVTNTAAGATSQPPVWQAVYLGNHSPFLTVVEKPAAGGKKVK